MATRVRLPGGDGDWNNTTFWSGGVVPINGDDVFIENISEVIDTNLNQSAVTLASLNIGLSFTGTIGTTTADLQISATLLRVGYHFGQGSPTGSTRIRLDLGSNICTGTIDGTATTSADNNLEPLRIIGTNASNVFTINDGIVGFATSDETEVATILELSLTGDEAQVHLTDGVTLAGTNVLAGTASLGCAVSGTIEQSGGTVTTYGILTVATWNINAGVGIVQSTGVITLAEVRGTIDYSTHAIAKTTTSLVLFAGSTCNLNTGNPLVPTITNGVDFRRCQISDVNFTSWAETTWTPSAI